MTDTTSAHDTGHGSAEPPAPAEPLRVGVLGAARIAELAIVKPARATGTRLVAIAARDQARASAFAAEHGVEQALASYTDVVALSDVEAVYNPLPNALHGTWNLAAIAAGKHVLSEKPFAANAEEAADVAAAAHGSGVTVVEGFHYLYHPVTRRLHELLASGDLGELVPSRRRWRSRTRVRAIRAGRSPSPVERRWTWAATACTPSVSSRPGAAGNRNWSPPERASDRETRVWTSGWRRDCASPPELRGWPAATWPVTAVR